MVLELNAAGTGLASGVDGSVIGRYRRGGLSVRSAPGYCSSSSRVSAGALCRLALAGPPTR